MGRLYVDKSLMVNEFVSKLKEQLDIVAKQIQLELMNSVNRNDDGHTKMRDAEAKAYAEIVADIKSKLVIYIDGNNEFLFDNYGSGSLMDTKNNALIDEYIGNDKNDNWNHYRSRSDTTIKGRDAGDYIDIFGNPRTSSGSMAGDDIEGLKIIDETTGGWIAIQPRYPSHLVEAAIEEFKVRCKSILNKAYDNMDFSKCLIYK